jgi:hypothetical protein
MPDMDEDLVPSSSSQSPDSLYSNSPVMQDNLDAFEFDQEEYEEHDVEEYEALMEEEMDGESDGRASPAWGCWPRNDTLGGPGWTPLPSQGSLTARHGSVISISPRGSVGGLRRTSTPASNGKFPASTSNPSLLFPNYSDERRRSSAKSASGLSGRRRSSIFSNGSIIDPAESERLRKFASMSQLARRFSELVQVISPLVGNQEQGKNDVDMAREMISAWSPYSTETDVSEIVTAPYVPTPQGPVVPALLSNYPLSSVAQEVSLDSPETDPESWQSARIGLAISHSVWQYTPPLPAEPRQILRARTRPNILRTTTDYELAPQLQLPKTDEDSVRPSLRRAVSTPQLTPVVVAPTSLRTIPAINRPTGSFPLARSQPLGLSRLRESTAPQKPVLVPEIRRPSLVAERRMSIVEYGSRRTSSPRKASITLLQPVTPPRKVSIDSRRGSSARKLSTGLLDLRKVSLDPSRKLSTASRRSSVVSLGEYGYLATQITPKAATSEAGGPSDTLRQRRNAPPSIVLPAYEFPARTLLSPGTSSATPRYNPLDSFFGRPTPALSSSSSPATSVEIDPLSPFSEGLKSPFSPGHAGGGVLDRGRPVASPEFSYSFPKPRQASGQKQGQTSPDISTQALGKSALRSPSYRFPVQAEGAGLMPVPLPSTSAGIAFPPAPGPRVTFDKIPLKSILVHKAADSLSFPPSVPRPVAHRATSHPPISDIHLSEDIQAHLRSKRESRIEQVQGESKVKPPMIRQSSFTRLFQRAKAQASSNK